MIKAIYTTGSSLFLPKPNDKDVVRFYETKEEKREALIKYRHDDERDVHFDYVRPLTVFLGCYIYHFMELVEGEDLHLADFDIFDAQIKKDYVALLNKYASWLKHDSKLWYHILTACYMYKNNSYDLTATQLKTIQSVHDKGVTDSKYKFCIETLKELS